MIEIIVKDRFVKEEGLHDSRVIGDIKDVSNGMYIFDSLRNGVIGIPKNQIWEIGDIEESDVPNSYRKSSNGHRTKETESGKIVSIISFTCDKNSRDFKCDKKPCVRVSDSRRMQGINHDFIEICSEAENVVLDENYDDEFDIISGEIADGSDFDELFIVRKVKEIHHYENGDVVEEVKDMIERNR